MPPKKYKTDGERKAAQRVSAKRFRKSERGKIAIKRYQQTEKRKATIKRHEQTEKRKASKCAAAKRYRQTEKYKIALKRNAKIRSLRQFGITLEQYDVMYKNQKGCCLICGRHQIEFTRRFAIDHDRETGVIGGLLCLNCNTGLGQFRHDINLMLKAIDYLKQRSMIDISLKETNK